MKFKSAYLSVALLLICASSMAASLGRHSGATLIGRPLDISVQAILNAQDDIANLCLEADVFYADNRLDKSRVRITAEKASTGSLDAVIRVRSAVLIDEPVVTVYVRVGCQQKIERRYVTLADMPSEAIADRSAPSFGNSPAQIFSQSPTLPARVPANNDGVDTNPANANAGNANASNVNVANARSTRNNRTTRDARNARIEQPTQNSQKAVDAGPEAATADAANSGNRQELKRSIRTKPPRADAVVATDKPVASSGSRLKLEPLDLSVKREPRLKSSSQLLSAPSTNLQERSAAAALWRAITAPPQDILRDFEKLQNLEISVRNLQAQNQKSQQSIEELGVKLQKTESGRYANALVYVLGMLLLLAVAALAYILYKQGLRSPADSSVPWWRGRGNSERLRNDWTDSGAHPQDVDFGRRSTVKEPKSEVSTKSGLANPEIKLGALNSGLKLSKTAPDFQTDSLPPLVSTYHADSVLSMIHPLRAVKAEELFDVNQQADFFVSIGQHEQAIEVLRNHIDDDVETSALVYLDLFNLYHQLARKTDYAALRENFNGRFNTKIPVFDAYTVAGPGLEAYQLAMSRIEALWPSPKVLEVIEDSIFKRPENDAEAFNLTAYRELLLLYSVAKEIISSDIRPANTPDAAGRSGEFTQSRKFELPVTSATRADSQLVEFVSTSIQPLSASIQESNSTKSGSVVISTSRSPSMEPPAYRGVGLDLDLTEPMPVGENRGANVSANTPDTGAFSLAESHAAGGAPSVPATARSAEKLAEPPGNLIAFDTFYDFDNALSKSEKPRPPKK